MGAVPVVLGAVSSLASTASSMSGGTSYNTKAMENLSLEQVSYLESRQKQKEALTLQMMDTAKNFANANFNSEVSQLETLRQTQQTQLEQQQLLAKYNYQNTVDTLANETYLNRTTDKYEDFQKNQQYTSSKFNRQQGIDARANQFQTAEAGREFSSLQGQASHQSTLQDSAYGVSVGEAQYAAGEASRGLEATEAKGTSAIGREQKLLELQRKDSQVDQADVQYDIQGSQVSQSGEGQKAQANMSLNQTLTGLNSASKEALSEASKRMITRGSSSSDRANYMNDQKITQLLEAKDQAALSNSVATGLIDAATASQLAGIDASKASLISERAAINSERNIDASDRRVALASLENKQKLASLSEKFQYLTIPGVSAAMSNSRSKLQNIDMVSAQNKISRDSDVASYKLANKGDKYNQSVEDAAYKADAGYNKVMRNDKYTSYKKAGITARSTYDQALSDVNYAQKLTDKSYDLGVYSAEQNRISTESATDLKQASYLAQQRAALSQALSGISTGMLSSGQTSGGSNWLSGLSSVAGTISGLYNQNQQYNAQSSYLNRMSNLSSGTSGSSLASTGSGI